MGLLQEITELSHEFGTVEYVRGGGGNTSVKDAETLWVKPSGTTLCGLTAEAFVAIDRKKIGGLYAVESPKDPSEREALVKNVMMGSRLEGATGRPSVEAPLHNSLSAKYIVHTHPAIVNGMTCATDGKAACQRLFPDALWLDYIDPGYTLCMVVRDEIEKFKAEKGVEPAMIFLKNHGVFVAADDAEGIRANYHTIMNTLRDEYRKAGISMELTVCDVPDSAAVAGAKESVASAFDGIAEVELSLSGDFEVYTGPISPDHIVYAYSFPFIGAPSAESIKQFQETNGYWPRIISFGEMVFGAGESQRKADLALEMSQDGALVTQLAGAFGGICYLTDRARDFIENWEVEAYRKTQI
ncbi:MAG: class II aldolase [Planctomycetes bacterium]|nr:class II aldolase [Planctomycetota bacterium]